MILRNYDNLMVAQRIATVDSSEVLGGFTSFGDESLTFRDMSGSVYPFRPFYQYNQPFNNFYKMDTWSSFNNRGQTYITAGKGSTPVTYDDYKLEEILTSDDAQKVNQNVSELVYDKETKSWSRTYNCVCVAKRDITIREVGIYFPVDYTSNGSSAKTVLLYRKVLDDDIVVPANASFILSFTTTVSANPNKPADYVASANVVE